ncbi:MAG: sigma-70 family RNA polymerase sigma factor [Candidatus Devosia phytovorans]|uniref:Sigma-70 family RNA polymerase sigma factor n=1 Tax=Candidatus Devosia phytovorans TaxID=3121372 RepID=A0AAJ5VXV0_9HYPH|nr:sigma-70 family RNA polymerase sigma factor [Devosia sp.]WEK05434.1 MAG: sigma-70 family RNA polymerase sigma factor [Devosia sp.]
MLRLMSDPHDAETLLPRIAKGDRTALAGLFQHESGRLVAIAQRILRRRELAEEAVQEVFVAVWKRAGQFDATRGSARGWLTTMTRNRALNMLRDGSRMDYHASETLTEMGDRAMDAQQAFDALAERDALRICLEQLDEPRRRAVLLCYVTGLSHGEAAATMQAPLGTIKAWIRRSVVSLQECLS